MFDRLLRVCLFTVVLPMLCFSAVLVAAEKVAPITIEADEAVLQEQEGASIYRGHVSLIQGGLHLDAEEIRVESVDGKLSRMIASGNPVTYKQTRAGKKNISAEASMIEYIASSSKAVFRGNAKLIQGSNSFSGDKIEYDARTETVTAGGQKKDERVIIVIQPEGVTTPKSNNTEAPAPGGTPTPPSGDPKSATESDPKPQSQPATEAGTDSSGAAGSVPGAGKDVAQP